MSAPGVWHCVQQGSGRPLVLLHGVGMSHTAWNPIMPQLAAERRVLAFDIAGFGETPPLRHHTPATGGNLLTALVASLEALGVAAPVDFAGNSLGGYLALEAAKAGYARSVVAISPAGLWREGPPVFTRFAVTFMYSVARASPRTLVRLAMKSPYLRELLLMLPLSYGSRYMSTEDAIQAAEDPVRATAFEDTLRNIGTLRDAQGITVPLTVAFGKLDWILPASCQNRDQLPPSTRWVEPSGWGHVPMWVDPDGVAALILEGTA